MRGMDLKSIAEAVGGRLVCPDSMSLAENETVEAQSVVIDSRKIEKGGLFVATVGERTDGHNYIGQVFRQGALGVICERIPELPDEEAGPCILVENSFIALKKLAAYYRSCMPQVRIVGVVGSVGKTSIKEIVASVLSQHYSVLKTEGNFNNEIGVPLTILRIRDEHEVAVVEMGISDFGEMNRLGEIVKPDAVIMTNIGPCHLEKLIDLDGVLRAKSEVFTHMRKGGLVVLNCEDDRLNTVTEIAGCRILRYGRGGDAYAENIVNLGLEGSSFTVNCGSMTFNTTITLPGRHQVMNALAATLIGTEFGLDAAEIAEGISAARTIDGRGKLIRTEQYLLVDDCYNANPKSMKAAIDMLGDATGRRCAVLGDMFELGEDADKLHAEVGRYVAQSGLDYLVCVGGLSKKMYEAARSEDSAFNVRYFERLEDFLDGLDSAGFEAGDTILIKASHGMGFAKIVDALQK